MTRRSISFVLPQFTRVPVGGYLVVYEYANYLARQGWQVTIIYPRRPELLSQSGTSLHTHLWSIKAALLSQFCEPWFKLDERIETRLVKSWSVDSVPDGDAVVATAWETAGPVAALPARKGRKYYIVQHLETWSGDAKDVTDTFRMPFTIIAISKWLSKIVQEAGASTVFHIPNGLNHDEFRLTNHATRATGILSLYHREAFKGVPDALEAIRMIHAEQPSTRVTMFGVFDRGKDIPDWVTYFKNPSRSTLAELYNNASVYLSASIAEGWALPPAEGMACGALFVGTDSGGCRDYADHEDTALLSPPRDPLALYMNLRRALAGGSDIEAIRTRGTHRVKNFTWDASGDKFQTLLESSGGRIVRPVASPIHDSAQL